MEISNAQIVKILRGVAAAYTIKKIGSIFQIRAYENAADSIEHSSVEIQDLWQEGKLNEVPTLGEKLQGYLNELFTKGKVRHFEAVQKGIALVVFDLLDITGIGPATAEKISKLGVEDLDDLKKKIKSGELVNKGFSAKIAQNIMSGLQQLDQRGSRRMLLPYAFVQAEKILNYLNKNPIVLRSDPLGSLRRMVATIGDLDFSACSNTPEEVIEYFCKMPGVVKVIEKGEDRASVMLNSGLSLDLLVGKPESYGALLQHFTGSKNHNIHLRTLANDKGYSLNEIGVRKVSGVKSQGSRNELIRTETEEEFYKILGMQTPPPEIREDTGEIEAALKHKLPSLIDIKDIKGDLHLHSNFPLKASHGPGADSIEDIVRKAEELGYSYIGISDHPPAFTTHSKGEMIKLIEKRTKFIQSIKSKTKSVRVLNSLEVDILGDGSLSVPDEAMATLDYCIAGIHSGHRGSKDEITGRIMKALENPNVDIISHPTNRLLNERESSDANWEEIFKFAAKNNKVMEINAFPNRLDLRDDLVRLALGFGVKLIINTDAHEVAQMDNIRFGVSVARRGWASKADIVNSWDWKKLTEWFTIK